MSQERGQRAEQPARQHGRHIPKYSRSARQQFVPNWNHVTDGRGQAHVLHGSFWSRRPHFHLVVDALEVLVLTRNYSHGGCESSIIVHCCPLDE